MGEEIIIGKRKNAPIGLMLAGVIIFGLGIILDVLFLIEGIDKETVTLDIIFLVLASLALLICTTTLINLLKTRKNTLPLAKFTEEDDEIEFYSILATSLKIKKDKIYRIVAKKNGQMQIFFYSDINQKLVLYVGFFSDAKECKETLKKYLKQDIK